MRCKKNDLIIMYIVSNYKEKKIGKYINTFFFLAENRKQIDREKKIKVLTSNDRCIFRIIWQLEDIKNKGK